MFCAQCGKMIPDEAAFCLYCGSKVKPFKPYVEKEVSVETQQDAQEAVPADFLAETVEKKSVKILGESSEAVPEIMSVNTEENSAEVLTEAQENLSKEVPAEVQEILSEKVPAEVQEILSEKVPAEAQEILSEEVSAEAQENLSKEVSADIAESVPAEASAKAPVEVPSYITSVTEDSAPETTGIPLREVTSSPQTPTVTPVVPVPAEQEQVKKGKGLKMLCIFGGIGLALILTIVLAFVFAHNAKQKKYNSGVTMLEEGDYAGAYEVFDSLADFDDSELMRDYAKVELDYLNMDTLVKDEDYQGIIELLEERSAFFGTAKKGLEADELLTEYRMLTEAIEYKNTGAYIQAADTFNSLTSLKEQFIDQVSLCRAYDAEYNECWAEILVNLYALQNGDPDKDFLQNPQTEEDFVMVEAIDYGCYEAEELLDIVRTDSPEAEALKETARKGFLYEEGMKQYYFENYEEAMAIFEELGDFKDSEEMYQECEEDFAALSETYALAESYYENGEYYKAMQLFYDLHGYLDSWEKAESCPQAIPSNGALKKGNGSGVELKIVVPQGEDYVFLKLYDASDNAVAQVFIHPGKSATINLKGGTYTIKAAYGTEWYGEIDLFGTSGSYQKLLNGYESTFKLSNNYSYTLTLGGVTDGNVGSESVGGADGM